MTREQYVADLRALADWLEAHPDIDPPRPITVMIPCENAARLLDARTAMGGGAMALTSDWISCKVDIGVHSVEAFRPTAALEREAA